MFIKYICALLFIPFLIICINASKNTTLTAAETLEIFLANYDQVLESDLLPPEIESDIELKLEDAISRTIKMAEPKWDDNLILPILYLVNYQNFDELAQFSPNLCVQRNIYNTPRVAKKIKNNTPYFLNQKPKSKKNNNMLYVHYPEDDFSATYSSKNKNTVFLHNSKKGLFIYLVTEKTSSIHFFPLDSNSFKKLSRYPLSKLSLSLNFISSVNGYFWSGPTFKNGALTITSPTTNKNPDYKDFSYSCHSDEEACRVSLFSYNKDEEFDIKAGETGFSRYKNIINKYDVFSEEHRLSLTKQCQKLADNNFRQWIKRLTSDLNNTCGAKAQHMLPDISEVNKICTMIGPMWDK